MDNAEYAITHRAGNAPRVTPEQITAVCEAAEFLRRGTFTICIIRLRNGYMVTGESACASPENYDQGIGDKVAFENARDKVWALEGYLLRQRLYESAL